MPTRWVTVALVAFALGASSARAEESESARRSSDLASINSVLNDLHNAAAKADESRYFGHFAPDAIFLGTDPTERWTMAAFKDYAHPFFASGKGWLYEPSNRNVTLNGDAATFDEQVKSAKYGLCRGTGSLARIGGEWKVTQYSLSFPVPNELAPKVVSLLRGSPILEGNQPPVIASNGAQHAQAGSAYMATIDCHDPDGDALTLTADGLPPGATLEQKPAPTDVHGVSHATATVLWPPDTDSLATRRFVAKCSDGHVEVRHEITVRIEESWESWMMPGVKYAGYFPNGASTIGNYNGAAAEFALFAFSHRNENVGPAIGRVTLDISLLGSSATKSALEIYELGVTLSFERNPSRRMFVPYFGLRLGGIHNDAFGSFFEATPELGCHIWAGRNVFVDASLGYLLTTEHLDELRGLRAGAGIDFSLW